MIKNKYKGNYFIKDNIIFYVKDFYKYDKFYVIKGICYIYKEYNRYDIKRKEKYIKIPFVVKKDKNKFNFGRKLNDKYNTLIYNIICNSDID